MFWLENLCSMYVNKLLKCPYKTIARALERDVFELQV